MGVGVDESLSFLWDVRFVDQREVSVVFVGIRRKVRVTILIMCIMKRNKTH